MNFPKKRPVFCLLVEDYFLIGIRVFKYRKCSIRHVKLSISDSFATIRDSKIEIKDLDDILSYRVHFQLESAYKNLALL